MPRDATRHAESAPPPQPAAAHHFEGAEDSRAELDEDYRHRLICAAAYEKYMTRGYCDGYDMEDWLAAEAEVDEFLSTVKRV
ncbi:MAG: DUF2934 domain-containing protein [Gammaproteobacteria bacterium]